MTEAFQRVHHSLNVAVLNAQDEHERSIWLRLRKELLTGFGIRLDEDATGDGTPAREEASNAA